MNRVFIGIGGNISPLSHIENLKFKLKTTFQSVSYSEFYTTEPFECGEQPPYINAVVRIYTDWEPEYLLETLLKWELEEGRLRTHPHIYEPRPLDLDLLLYENRVQQTDFLTLPHPKVKERKFVLLPLLDLEPELIDPISKKPYKTFFNNLSDQGVYRFSLKKYN